MAMFHRSCLLVVAGFAAGVCVCATGFVFASPSITAATPSGRSYLVSLDEIRSNLFPAKVFSGEFSHKVTLSDGSVRKITLRPVRRDGQELVELYDQSGNTAFHSFMGPNGTTTDGKLMISVKDVAQLQAAMQPPRGGTVP